MCFKQAVLDGATRHHERHFSVKLAVYHNPPFQTNGIYGQPWVKAPEQRSDWPIWDSQFKNWEGHNLWPPGPGVISYEPQAVIWMANLWFANAVGGKPGTVPDFPPRRLPYSPDNKKIWQQENGGFLENAESWLPTHLTPYEYGVRLCWPWETQIWSPICHAGRLDCPIGIQHRYCIHGIAFK